MNFRSRRTFTFVPRLLPGAYFQSLTAESTSSSRTLPPDSATLRSVIWPVSLTTYVTVTETESPGRRRGARPTG